MQIATTREDRLGRFTPTPLAADLRVMGRTVRLETNSATVLRHARQVFDPYGAALPAPPDFVWRIVSERDRPPSAGWPEMNGFSDGDLFLGHLGKSCFLAADHAACEAVGYLPDELAEDETGFACLFLAALFQGTAMALRLTSVSAACVALSDKGLLLFGSPESGKTTACYLATKLGVEFLSDQATFLEFDGRGVRAWGQFWPAIFSREATKFLPELGELSRPISFQGRDSVALVTPWLPKPRIESVVPALCVFLEREASDVPRLIPLSSRDFLHRLEARAFAGAAGLARAKHAEAGLALSKLPAYRLAYGRDPGAAAIFFHSLLKTHNLLEARA